jgi:hypothetical protein
MAIQGNASYIPTTEEFIAHWGAANGLLTPPEQVVLPGAPLGWPTEVNQSVLEGLLTDLANQVVTIQSKANGAALVRGDLAIKQGALLAWFGQFTDKVRGKLPGTKWINALPYMPTAGDAQSRFCDPMDDVSDLWARLNADQALGPGVALVLRDGTTQGDFTAKVGELKALWRSLKQADLELKLARGQRDAVQARIYPILKSYRVVLPTYFAPGSAIVVSLPRLTPEAGTTPTPAVLTHVWNGGTQKADITAVVPAQAGLKKARLLYSPGSSWSEEDASVVATKPLSDLNAAQSVVFSTDFALSGPGSTALFRVVVVNETDNEASSNVVEVTRP